MYKAIVQDKSFEIVDSKEGHVVNGIPVTLDIVSISENYFHVIYKNRSYRAEVVKADPATKTFVFKINGREYPVLVKNKFDLLLEQMGLQNVGAAKLNLIKAPMPGLIIDLKVVDGQEVKQNEPLLILEHGFRVRPDIVATRNERNPREYLGRFYVDSLVHEPAMLRYMIDLMGAECIALGSDYPFPLGEQHPGSMIESMNLDSRTRDTLLAGAALNWLKLERSRFT